MRTETHRGVTNICFNSLHLSIYVALNACFKHSLLVVALSNERIKQMKGNEGSFVFPHSAFRPNANIDANIDKITTQITHFYCQHITITVRCKARPFNIMHRKGFVLQWFAVQFKLRFV
ncbi:CLUMA_CG008221, isoform A [Clunio marinus]|uniref:CLUMA_CG008221, isoform A n=1 Tax=Clunio marinus TaxID=568069 RepID=A0A1J1I8H6_9DIPT|nr:CLUMA_CG008221, isoform A [Clunio marinus]